MSLLLLLLHRQCLGEADSEELIFHHFHPLPQLRKFKSAESILRKVLVSGSIDLPSKLFEAILYSYRLCDSSPHVFDSLFKTFAHMKKFRNATNTFCQMKDYGFFPTVESCNAYLNSEMQRCRISPNVCTLNMVISAYCKLGKLDNAVEVLEKMDSVGFSPTVVSYNTLIAGHCDKELDRKRFVPNASTFSALIEGKCVRKNSDHAFKLCKSMIRSGYQPVEHTFKMLISSFCNNRDFDGAVEVLKEMFERSIALDSSILSDLCLGLCRCGNEKMEKLLCSEMEARRSSLKVLTWQKLSPL
ncbi:hypothetical protein ACE6H2_011577 [Prunus campanulata]